MNVVFEKTGIHYRQEGEYALPDLEVPESPKVGIWGECRRKYMREHQKALYTAMMLSDTLNTHLEEVDRSADEMYEQLTLQTKVQEGISKELKATNQMEWVQQMNSIRSCAAEIVYKELIYHELVNVKLQMCHCFFANCGTPCFRSI